MRVNIILYIIKKINNKSTVNYILINIISKVVSKSY